jgi:ATP-dependent DNA helicase RecQ
VVTQRSVRERCASSVQSVRGQVGPSGSTVRHPLRTIIPMADDLLDALRTLTSNPEATFRAHQREAVEALVARQRVLLVQRTGWGKSAVYFLATHLLRREGLGPTLLISPLLALIRNQIDAANRLGLRTVTINSASTTRVGELADALHADEVDLLLVSPERLANPEFADRVMPLISRQPGLMVIDEAHCISDWGHDFRPDYRRLAQVINGFGDAVPVLACTATANDRVVDDVAEQLGAIGNVIRGPLGRDGLSLHVVNMPSAANRLAWLHQVLPTLPGTGIIYCLTIRDAEQVADWLRRNGHDVRAYSGATDESDRLDAELALQENRVKALVATSALGMGYDKPDLAFVIHFQSPGSPIAYYQQVGRGGRQLDQSFGILLRGAEDRDIQDWFIDTAFPNEQRVDEVLRAFDDGNGPLTMSRLLEAVNMKRSDCELVLKQLTVEGVLRRTASATYERTAAQWVYPTQRVQGITADRRREQQQMVDYGTLGTCRMAFLTGLLDDPVPRPCGVCDNCAAPRFDVAIDQAGVASAEQFVRRGYITIEPRKKKLGKVLNDDRRFEPGLALCRATDHGWGTAVREGRASGRFDDRLVAALAAMVTERRTEPVPGWVTFVPSQRAPVLVADLAERLAAHLALPCVALLRTTRAMQPQHQQHNGTYQEQNVRGAFALVGAPRPDPVLLVDDLVDSRWTLTEVAAVLRDGGSGPVVPAVLGSQVG